MFVTKKIGFETNYRNSVHVTYAHKETKTFKCATNETARKVNVWKGKKYNKEKENIPFKVILCKVAGTVYGINRLITIQEFLHILSQTCVVSVYVWS